MSSINFNQKLLKFDSQINTIIKQEEFNEDSQKKLEKIACSFFTKVGEMSNEDYEKLEQSISQHTDDKSICALLKVRSAISKGGLLSSCKPGLCAEGLNTFDRLLSSFDAQTYHKAKEEINKNIFMLYNNPQNVKAFLDNGGDPNLTDFEGNSLICLVNTLEAAEMLIKAGAKINYQNDEYTPLIMAVMTENVELVDLLLKNGADVSLGTKGTALESAAALGNLELIKKLLPYCSASKNYPKNEQAWFIAKINGYQEITDELKKANFKTDFSWKVKQIKTLGHQFSWPENFRSEHNEWEQAVKVNGLAIDAEFGPKIWFGMMSKSLQDLEGIPENHRIQIQEALQLAGGDTGPEDYLAAFQAGKPIIVPTGWETHSVEMVFFPPLEKDGQAVAFLCNRGASSEKPVEVFSFDKDKLNANVLRKFLRSKAEVKDYLKAKSELEKTLDGNHEGPLASLLEHKFSTLPSQKMGNCTWMSAETAILVLMTALEIKDQEKLTLNSMGQAANNAIMRHERYGNQLRLDRVENFFVGALEDKKGGKNLDHALILKSFESLWQLKIQSKQQIKHLEELEEFYLSYCSPPMQILFDMHKQVACGEDAYFTLDPRERAALKEGLTPAEAKAYLPLLLHFCNKGNHRNVELLLEAGIDPSAPCRGKYALIEALKQRDATLMRILLENNANPNVKDYGVTALYLAIDNDDTAMVRLLMAHGADKLTVPLPNDTKAAYEYQQLIANREASQKKDSEASL